MTVALHHARDLADFVMASPSSFHAAFEGARRLREAGFVRQDEAAEWSSSPGGHYLVRDGALIAWWVPRGAGAATPYRIVGAHTDSPTFKLKPRPEQTAYGWQQVGVEVYGGPLLNSWLDRELGLAGRLVLRDGREVLVRTEAVLRIPQLAIHLDRAVNDEGVKLDKQLHTLPIWGIGSGGPGVMHHLATLAGCKMFDIVGHDIVAYATTPGEVFGSKNEFLASGRLDNLSSVHAGVTALIGHARQASGLGGVDHEDVDPAEVDHGAIAMLAAFDHEEIGSGSRSGAAGPILADVVERISTALGAGLDERHRSLINSFCLSADAGHAVHPNYAQRHDVGHRPLLNGGPLLKINANQRYATDARGAALWRRACAVAGVTTQEFVSNNAIPCGSTIGPLTATRMGITTVDVGVPLLSMHSARELAGVEDPNSLSRGMEAFFTVA